jgi:hypothetical protein
MGELSYFLTDDDLFRLTGRKQHSARIKQLKALDIPYTSNADGKPLVPRAALDQRMGLVSTTAAAANCSNDDGFRLE